jgi:hypothetical protein
MFTIVIKAKEKMPKKVSLEGFIKFVNKKKGSYNYLDNGNCAFGQYLKSVGYKTPSVGGAEYCIVDKHGVRGEYYEMYHLHGSLSGAISGRNVDFRDIKHTFEDLSRRLKECCT